MMINRTKRFNKKLWKENDKKGKEFATSMLKKIYGNNIKIVEGIEYGVDLKLFNEDNILIKTAEVEVRHNWSNDSKFPFDTLNIPYRKKKFFTNNICEYVSINRLFTRCLLIKEKDILNSPIEENKNKYVKSGEKFFKIDISKCKEYTI
jgi:hypothetical protein